MERRLFDTGHDDFRQAVRAFVRAEVTPHLRRWEEQGRIDRDLFRTAGRQGLLGLSVPKELGGGGLTGDFRYDAVLAEELCEAGATSVAMAVCGLNNLVLPYLTSLCSDQQKRRYLPECCTGELYAAIAMTEPGTGSDLRSIRAAARRTGTGWVLSGSKTLISNGLNADVFVVVAATGEGGGKDALSLLLVDGSLPGVTRGAGLPKMGLKAQDTVELFFSDVELADDALLGEEGAGFGHLTHNLAQERLLVAVMAVSSVRRLLALTTEYVTSRSAFGQPIAQFQNTRFALAEMATELKVTETFVDRCVLDQGAGRLSAVDAAMAKWWATELQQRTATRCVQLHGGYGYITEYEVAREFLDARASTLYAGTTEIMKEIIGRSWLRDTTPRA